MPSPPPGATTQRMKISPSWLILRSDDEARKHLGIRQYAARADRPGQSADGFWEATHASAPNAAACLHPAAGRATPWRRYAASGGAAGG
jgi:hypothetical protein